jgi:hypothetical protein
MGEWLWTIYMKPGVAYFNTDSQNLPGGTEENNSVNISNGQTVLRTCLVLREHESELRLRRSETFINISVQDSFRKDLRYFKTLYQLRGSIPDRGRGFFF